MTVFVCCFKSTGSHVIHINEDNYKVFRKKKMTGQSVRRLSFTTGKVWRSCYKNFVQNICLLPLLGKLTVCENQSTKLSHLSTVGEYSRCDFLVRQYGNTEFTTTDTERNMCLSGKRHTHTQTTLDIYISVILLSFITISYNFIYCVLYLVFES
jgi:hypothetical protein